MGSIRFLVGRSLGWRVSDHDVVGARARTDLSGGMVD